MAAQYQVQWTFGMLESVLSQMHWIDDTKRTAFQSRLKNFHRLGWPIGLQTTKGKAATYSAGEAFSMAMAVELTQLGLPPERIVRVLSANWFPLIMAARVAARSLSEWHSIPLAMFVYFDPNALAPMTQALDHSIAPDSDTAACTFFYGGIGIIKDNLEIWTHGGSGRISLLNVTTMISRLSSAFNGDLDDAGIAARDAFCRQLVEWSEAFEKRLTSEGQSAGLTEYVYNFLERGWFHLDLENVPSPVNLAAELSENLGLDERQLLPIATTFLSTLNREQGQ